MTPTQPEALRIAELLNSHAKNGACTSCDEEREATTELLRLHAENKALRASHGQALAGAAEEVENLRKALVYAAFALHGAPQYMLAQGITLIDGDTVRVSRDGWTVEASVNPHRQPAPATQQPEGDVVAKAQDTREPLTPEQIQDLLLCCAEIRQTKRCV